jgi:hypothetical protein
MFLSIFLTFMVYVVAVCKLCSIKQYHTFCQVKSGFNTGYAWLEPLKVTG